jgi:hypothetical protein
MTVDEYFEGQALSRQLFDVLERMVREIGPTEIRVTKSQVAFVGRKAFAWAWMPGIYLKRKVAPLVLTLPLPYRDGSLRWKQIVEPTPGNYIHHLELYSLADIDEQVSEWLQRAWNYVA